MNSEFAVQTRSGRFIDPFDPDPELMVIEDIAWALARKGRFIDHTRLPFPVAAHSLVVSSWCPPSSQLWGLLHDLSETYTGDLASPIKRHPSMAGYRRMEAGLTRAGAARFGLPLPMPREVKAADTLSAAAEAKLFMSRVEEFHDWPKWKDLDTAPFEEMILELVKLPGPEAIEAAFLDRYFMLEKARAASTGGSRS